MAELEVGKYYQLAGYEWMCAEKIDGGYVLQSTGVTSGYWPGYKMSKWGNGNLYNSNIDGQDISDYDENSKHLYDNIKKVEKLNAIYGTGLYLVSNTMVSDTHDSNFYYKALKDAAGNHNLFDRCSNGAWLGTVNGSNNAWLVDLYGSVYNNYYQIGRFVIAPAFNIDSSKIHLEGDEIKIDAPKKTSRQSARLIYGVEEKVTQLEVGKYYQFAGYEWMCAEQIEGGYCLQSTGVTSGQWPGYVMSKFGGSANANYSANIDGENIRDYNNTTQKLYSVIGETEKTGAEYGSGLFLVSNLKVNQTVSTDQGSGQYWLALRAAATNYSLFGAGKNYAWLGAVNDSSYAWHVDLNGNVKYNNQGNWCVIAPAFNLDSSKIHLEGDEIKIGAGEGGSKLVPKDHKDIVMIADDGKAYYHKQMWITKQKTIFDKDISLNEYFLDANAIPYCATNELTNSNKSLCEINSTQFYIPTTNFFYVVLVSRISSDTSQWTIYRTDDILKGVTFYKQFELIGVAYNNSYDPTRYQPIGPMPSISLNPRNDSIPYKDVYDRYRKRIYLNCVTGASSSYDLQKTMFVFDDNFEFIDKFRFSTYYYCPSLITNSCGIMQIGEHIWFENDSLLPSSHITDSLNIYITRNAKKAIYSHNGKYYRIADSQDIVEPKLITENFTATQRLDLVNTNFFISNFSNYSNAYRYYPDTDTIEYYNGKIGPAATSALIGGWYISSINVGDRYLLIANGASNFNVTSYRVVDLLSDTLETAVLKPQYLIEYLGSTRGKAALFKFKENMYEIFWDSSNPELSPSGKLYIMEFKQNRKNTIEHELLWEKLPEEDGKIHYG